ncbi:hypothetical protein SAMN05660657_04656 [Geodermatophilus amargosae]|uniref:Transglycosylase SLT domain-containing protein n=1 Tax=Geodermatophilus amargosae TaxID=1296565 RepID=A0A1I7CLY8_9ACTN|nr:hypothetical protein [Geodermatophilus amargosae]SFU00450.1 hypothetical protein SAMN05660657_04656 [Geodermatophilus amargosae]
MTSARTAPPRRPAPAARRPAAKRPPAKRTAARGPAGKRPSGRPAGGAAALRTWWPAYLLAVVVVFALAWRADGSEAAEPAATTGICTVPATSVTLAADQWANARTIADVARQRGLPERAVVIALATAMQESTLHNLDHGDRDSLGLFQQRPSQGWGTPAQVQDPVYAAGQFYDRLVRVPGWDTMRLTDAAQTVQRSGFPEAYQRWDGFAQSLTVALRSDDRERNCG